MGPLGPTLSVLWDERFFSSGVESIGSREISIDLEIGNRLKPKLGRGPNPGLEERQNAAKVPDSHY